MNDVPVLGKWSHRNRFGLWLWGKFKFASSLFPRHVHTCRPSEEVLFLLIIDLDDCCSVLPLGLAAPEVATELLVAVTVGDII